LSISPSRLHIIDIEPGQIKAAVVKIDNTGGPYTRFRVDDPPVPWLNIREVRTLTDQPLPLELVLEITGAGSPGEHLDCRLPVRLENEGASNRSQSSINLEVVMAADKPASGLKMFGPGLAGIFGRKGSQAPPDGQGWMAWLKSLLLVCLAAAAGLLIYGRSGMLFPLALLVYSSAVFSAERWHREGLARFEWLGGVYKLALNLGILALAGLIGWTAADLFSGQPEAGYTAGGLLLGVEILLFIFLASVLSENSWRRPKMVPTVLSVFALLVVLALAGIQPLADYGAVVIDWLVSVYERIRDWIISIG